MPLKTEKKRLLINFAGLGDLVILIPQLRMLAEGAELDLVTRSFGTHLFEGQSFVSCTFPLAHPNRGKKWLGKLLLGQHRAKLAKELAKRKYDEIYYYAAEREVITDWVESWRGSGIVKKLTTPYSQSGWVTAGLSGHGFNLEEIEPYPRLEISAEDKKNARIKLQTLGDRVVAVQVGTGPVNVKWRKPFNVKGLAPQQWGWIITHILETGDGDAIIFHGTPNESQFIAPIMECVPERFHGQIHDWTDGVGIKELQALLSVHYAMVSVDTGPAHIAAAVGCPLLVFFGPTPPEKYLMKGSAPVEMVQGKAPCMPCQHTKQFKKCRENICLNRLEKEELIEGWDRLVKYLK